MNIKIKRAYEPAERSDGYRVLVDRLWPRGIKKEAAHVDQWIREVAPSTALRKWFNHETEKWTEFVTRYRTELKGSEAFGALSALAKEHPTITFVYGAKDEEHNQAVALKKFLSGHHL